MKIDHVFGSEGRLFYDEEENCWAVGWDVMDSDRELNDSQHYGQVVWFHCKEGRDENFAAALTEFVDAIKYKWD